MGKNSYLNFISVRYRYLFSFLIVACIPIVFILVFFYNYNVKELKQDIESINVSRVAQIKSGFEGEILKYYRLSRAIYEDQSLLPLMKSREQEKIYDALVILRHYMNYRDINPTTAVVLTNRDCVFIKSGISSRQVFLDSILKIDATGQEKVEALLQDSWRDILSTVIPVTRLDGTSALMFLYSVEPYSTKPEAVMITLLENSQVITLFEPILSRMQGKAFVLNGQTQLVWEFQNAIQLDESVNESILSIDYTDMHQQFVPIKIENNKYSIFYSQSQQTGLIYGIVAENNTYLTRVVKQTTLIWQMVLFALIICIIVIVLLTIANYHPLMELVTLVGISNENHQNEYERIKAAIMDNASKADQLAILLEQQRPYMLERLFSYALDPDTSPQQIRQLFLNMNIGLKHPLFFVMCVKALRNQTTKQGYSFFKEIIIDTVVEMNTEQCSYSSVERSDENEIVIVANCSQLQSQKDCVVWLQQALQASIGEQYIYTIGVGSIKESVDELKGSLYEASILVQNQAEKNVSYLQDLEECFNNTYKLYPIKEVMLFKQQLRQGDEISAKSTFEQLCSLAEENSNSFLISQYSYSYIVNAIAEVVQQLDYPELNQQIHKLMTFENKCAFTQYSTSIIETLCELINVSKQSNNHILRNNIMNYVIENIADVNLSLDSIGENFNLSSYYISRFFRDQSNINIKDYITALRIDKAKELLVTTTIPISEIVHRIGYISGASFIRKFRLIEGITPGKYRERFSKKN